MPVFNSFDDAVLLLVKYHQHQSRPGQKLPDHIYLSLQNLKSVGLITEPQGHNSFVYRLTERGEQYIQEAVASSDGKDSILMPGETEDDLERARAETARHTLYLPGRSRS